MPQNDARPQLTELTTVFGVTIYQDNINGLLFVDIAAIAQLPPRQQHILYRWCDAFVELSTRPGLVPTPAAVELLTQEVTDGPDSDTPGRARLHVDDGTSSDHQHAAASPGQQRVPSELQSEHPRHL